MKESNTRTADNDASIASADLRARYIQFGAGLNAPLTWRNFDVSPTLRAQRLPVVGEIVKNKLSPRFPDETEFGDVVTGLPVPAGSAIGVYCSHVLEHLSLADMRQALRNVHDILQPNGVFRLVVPDLERIAREYVARLEGPRAEDAAGWFMRETTLGTEDRPRGPVGILRSWVGNSSHLWMWDEPAMTAELRSAGFRDIRRARVGDAEDGRFADVEEAGRWDGALGMECRK